MADSTVIATISAMAIHPPNVNPFLDEDVIELRMVDEGGGLFFELRQDDRGPIRADPADLHALVAAAEQMLGQERGCGAPKSPNHHTGHQGACVSNQGTTPESSADCN